MRPLASQLKEILGGKIKLLMKNWEKSQSSDHGQSSTIKFEK